MPFSFEKPHLPSARNPRHVKSRPNLQRETKLLAVRTESTGRPQPPPAHFCLVSPPSQTFCCRCWFQPLPKPQSRFLALEQVGSWLPGAAELCCCASEEPSTVRSIHASVWHCRAQTHSSVGAQLPLMTAPHFSTQVSILLKSSEPGSLMYTHANCWRSFYPRDSFEFFIARFPQRQMFQIVLWNNLFLRSREALLALSKQRARMAAG